MTDEAVIGAVRTYMEQHPHCSRNQLRVGVKVSLQRIDKLHRQGLIPTVPNPMSASDGGKIGARRSWYRTGFKLKGSL